MKLPAISFSAVTVGTNPVDMDRWFPMLGVSPTHHTKVTDEITRQKESIHALINITHMGNGLLTALEPLQAHCSKYRNFIALQKTQAICQMIASELEKDKSSKIVLFAWHRDVMVDLYERLYKFYPLTLYQGSDEESKKRAMRKFARTKKYRVFISNIRAASTKIDLTFANEIGFVESSWKMSDNAQAVLRVHRYGQERNVNVRWFGLENDIDEKIQRLIKTKTLEIIKNQEFSMPDAEARISG